MLYDHFIKLAILPLLLWALQTTVSFAQGLGDCIEIVAIRGAAENQAKGYLINNCDKHVAVVFGYDKKFDGTPKANPWCKPEDDYVYLEEHITGSQGPILDPGETLSVGYGFKESAKFNVSWAACEIDTSKNNSVFFLMTSPYFRFNATCKHECE